MTKGIIYWTLFNFDLFKGVEVKKRRKKGHRRQTLNNIIIAGDTETSKKRKNLNTEHNHICAWSMAFKIDNDIYSVYGRKPSEMVECINKIQANLQGEETLIYFHNLAYDYVFLRKFFYKVNKFPVNELATRSHYPINVEFENGICLRDSLILAQCKLAKWAEDLNVEDGKEIDMWDYEKLRNQDTPLTVEEVGYIKNDVVALVECLDAYLKGLNKSLLTVPYTATGNVRTEVRERGNKNFAHAKFQDIAPSLELQEYLECVYHGGFVHGNRYYITDKLNHRTIKGDVYCYDFTSSYPYCLVAEQYPISPFKDVEDMALETVLTLRKKYAIIGTLILTDVQVKEDVEMPILQWSKCESVENEVLDNGRILAADTVVIKTHEQRMLTIYEQYKYSSAIVIDIKISTKGYLPKWLRDYIFERFIKKCELKDGDPVQYSIAKALLNSIYGLFVQKPIALNITEDYYTGDYEEEKKNEIPIDEMNERYEKFLNRWGSVLPYQWGVWCTAYGERHLIELSRCFSEDGLWLYSDTDSAFGKNWDMEKLNAYNAHIKEKLINSGYNSVTINGREFWLGEATLDKHFTEFRFTGAKRYCGRDAKTGELKITVAGVPKEQGAECLDNDIEKFVPGFVFKGEYTGKLKHKYLFVDKIYIDDDGNETGDSIDLTPCDYKLDNATVDDLLTYLYNKCKDFEEVIGYEYSYN